MCLARLSNRGQRIIICQIKYLLSISEHLASEIMNAGEKIVATNTASSLSLQLLIAFRSSELWRSIRQRKRMRRGSRLRPDCRGRRSDRHLTSRLGDSSPVTQPPRRGGRSSKLTRERCLANQQSKRKSGAASTFALNAERAAVRLNLTASRKATCPENPPPRVR
jgi:hypothetical protein